MRDGVVSSLPSELLDIDRSGYYGTPYPLSWRRQSVVEQQVVDLTLLDAMVFESAFLSAVQSTPQDRTLDSLNPSD